MANQSTFPTTLDAQSPAAASADNLSSSEWNKMWDAVDQLETKVGIDTSTVNTTLDWKLTSAGSYDPGHRHTKVEEDAFVPEVLSASTDSLYWSASTFIARGIDTLQFPGTDLASRANSGAMLLITNQPGSIFSLADRDILRVKTSDSTVTNSTTRTGDSTLAFSAAAGEFWKITWCILCNGGKTSDIQLGIKGPANMIIRWGDITAFDSRDVTTTSTPPTDMWDDTDTPDRGLNGTASDQAFYCQGLLWASSDTGSVCATYSQVTASATALTIKTGSWLKASYLYG